MTIAIFKIADEKMPSFVKSLQRNRKQISLSFCLVAVMTIVLTGCSDSLMMMNQPHGSRPPSLSVATRSGSDVLFYQDKWQLTLSGIRGYAEIHQSGFPSYTKDTTISYFQVAAVDSRGEDPWTQLLLTILGVIIVIGLAGVILYAAFRATER